MTYAEKYGIMLDVAQGALHIQQQGVVHRQITPANVYIGAETGTCIGNFAHALRISEARAFNANEELDFEINSTE